MFLPFNSVRAELWPGSETFQAPSLAVAADTARWRQWLLLTRRQLTRFQGDTNQFGLQRSGGLRNRGEGCVLSPRGGSRLLSTPYLS